MSAEPTVRFETPEGAAIARVVPGALAYEPEWSLVSLTARRPDRDAHYAFAAEACGSDGPFYDAFLFGKEGLTLESVTWKVPEENGDEDEARVWLGAPCVEGTLRLPTFEGFGAEPVEARVFLGDEDCLLGLTDLRGGGERLRVKLGRGLALLVEGGVYAGWMLEGATARLTPPSLDIAVSHAVIADEEARALVARFLHLVDMNAIDKLGDGDAEIREAMMGLRYEVIEAKRPNGVDEIVSQWIADIVERIAPR